MQAGTACLCQTKLRILLSAYSSRPQRLIGAESRAHALFFRIRVQIAAPQRLRRSRHAGDDRRACDLHPAHGTSLRSRSNCGYNTRSLSLRLHRQPSSLRHSGARHHVLVSPAGADQNLPKELCLDHWPALSHRRLLDFFFARYFFVFPNPAATLGIKAPALGAPVPIEEYVFYLTGFLCVLLLYIWLDEYWLAAYTVEGASALRQQFRRLLKLHPESIILAVALVIGAILFKKYLSNSPAGFPGYFIFLALAALVPSAALLSSARPVINWRAFSLTAFFILLVSLMWEVTLAIPYGWWNFRAEQMLGVRITAWGYLPIEEVCLWMTVTYATVIVYETVKCWQSSGRSMRHAFFGNSL